MKIFLVGICCVGKTTIGRELARTQGYRFYDLDKEIESYFKKSISQIQSMFIGDYSYRNYVAIVLRRIINENKNSKYIVALPPSGLRDCFLREIKKEEDRVIIAIHDRPENILKRLCFYDDSSNKIEKTLTEKEKKRCLRELRLDNTYFNRTYKRANYHVDIDGLSINESVEKIEELIRGIEKNDLIQK
ncbi:MAG: AAA family ATPase [Thermoplasmata archaeon]|nr:MAG: AAA family ATPase [Thermoplasmata archaeon]